MFLSFEELPDDERPPKRIWMDPVKLDKFFTEVKRNRERQYSGQHIEDPVENAAADLLIVGD